MLGSSLNLVRRLSPRFRRWGSCVLAGLLSVGSGTTATSTRNQTLSAAISPNGKLSVPGSVALISAGGPTFPAFTGTLIVSYRARTTPGGSGAITLQITSDFSPAGGPSGSGGDLTYTCTGASLGTNCSGVQAAGTLSATPLVTIPASACTGGGGVCSVADPNTAQANFVLANYPAFQTGTYSAVLTFVISAT